MNYKKEIKYEKLKMKEYQGDLISLNKEWLNKSKELEMDTVSIGKTAEKIWGDVGVLEEINSVSKEISKLLENTISFFENIGISFEETDSTVAKALKKEIYNGK